MRGSLPFFAQAAFAALLLASACDPPPRAPAPPVADETYTMLPVGLLALGPGNAAALVAGDATYLLQNAHTAVFVWRDSTFLGAVSDFADVSSGDLPPPDSPPAFVAGDFRIVFAARKEHDGHVDMLVGIVYRWP